MKILIIDDSKDIADPVRFLITLLGAECEWSCCGSDGIDKVKTFQPDLVLLDIMMPDVDGIEVLRQLRAGAYPGKISMMSAVPGPEIIKYCLSMGANGYVTKGKIDVDLLRGLLLQYVPEGDALAEKLREHNKPEQSKCPPSHPVV